MYAVKVTYKGEVRRLQLSVTKSADSYAKLVDTIRSIFPSLPQHFSLTWKDDEEDIVTVSSDLELQEAIRVMTYHHGLLKFTVNDTTARPTCHQGPGQGHPQCFKNNRGGCFPPFGFAHPQPNPNHNFGRRHPCGRGFGPREGLFNLFGGRPGPAGAAPSCPGYGPRYPPAHAETFFGIPMEAVTNFAEALALELSEAIQKEEQEQEQAASTAKTATAAASSGPAVHVGVTCDVCGVRPITGPRYKCTVRNNYDVCAACYEGQLQPYPMLKIVTNGGVGTVVTPGAPVHRDLNDEDAGLQAAISESLNFTTAPAAPMDVSVPPALSRSTISETSATVDDEGVEDVYSEGEYSVVSNSKSVEKFSLAADREAALTTATATTASVPPAVPAALVWAKELQLLSDMGFTDNEELIPLLQQHIATPASSAGPGAVSSVEGIQKVVSTLLFR